VRLVAFDQVALDHDADHVPRARRDLLRDGARHERLLFVVLAAVAVAAVDHEPAAQPGLLERVRRGLDARGVVVGP
jgi:hypothetical protein